MAAELLDQIVRRKRDELAAGSMSLPRRTRPVFSLEAALSRAGVRVIMECKRTSPSAGQLFTAGSLAPVVDAYDGIADAISVLTEPTHFDGSLEDLAFVAARVRVPVLRKDFILDPRQMHEAHAWGADAVLLMMSVVTDAEWRECARAADRLGIDVLTEVHDEGELERALSLDARVIGINNRSFADLSVNLDTTRRLAAHIPADRVVVSESGIRTHADIVALAPKVDAFLVGSTLMAAPDIGLAARHLVFGAIKVCGLTRPADARSAWQAGASFGGVVFADGSPRRVDIAQAQAIAAATPLPLVGVFVDAAPQQIAAHAAAAGLVGVQLHGQEDAATIAAVRAALPPGVDVWKAVRVGEPIPPGASLYLYDSANAGSGAAFDWRGLPSDMSQHGLAGGLHAGNVRDALATGVQLLDVSSGVESAPGIKCPIRLREFFDAIREACI